MVVETVNISNFNLNNYYLRNDSNWGTSFSSLSFFRASSSIADSLSYILWRHKRPRFLLHFAVSREAVSQNLHPDYRYRCHRQCASGSDPSGGGGGNGGLGTPAATTALGRPRLCSLSRLPHGDEKLLAKLLSENEINSNVYPGDWASVLNGGVTRYRSVSYLVIFLLIYYLVIKKRLRGRQQRCLDK